MSIWAMSAATPAGEGLGTGLGRKDGTETGSDEVTGPTARVGDGAGPAQAVRIRQLSVLQAEATKDTTTAKANAVRIALFNAYQRRWVR